MYKTRKKFEDKEHKLAITYLGDTHESRRNLKESFKYKQFTHFLEKLKFEDYLLAMNNYKFVLCPRGCGTDTHRFWEVILTGSVPVLETSGLDSLYQNFPCIIVNNFSEVTQELLDSFVMTKEKFDNIDRYLIIQNLKNKLFG